MFRQFFDIARLRECGQMIQMLDDIGLYTWFGRIICENRRSHLDTENKWNL